jgi:hypothetical protein
MTKWHNVYFIYKLWKKKYYSLSSKISDFLTCLSQWDRKTTITMPFYVSTAISWWSSLTYQRMHLLFNSNMTSFISREGPTYHSGVSDFTLGFQCDSCWSMLSFFLCNVLSTIVCPFVVFLWKLSHNCSNRNNTETILYWLHSIAQVRAMPIN